MIDRYLYWQHCRLGRTLDDLAEEMGMTRYQVHDMIIEYRYAIGEVVISDARLRDYQKRGFTIRAIAEAEACSVGVICKKLHNLHSTHV